jgi:glycosyltransferase involved in cell wall biosynthesis
MTRWKGQEDLCHIVAALKDEISNIHGLIVGEIKRDKEDFYKELKKLVKQLGIESYLTFTDHRNDVREVMAISDVVLSLSHEPEAFGRTPIEALAMGVPVVGYAHGGVAEQLDVVFPQGRVKPKNYLGAARRIKEWHDEMPTVAPTTAFRLQTMLDNTLTVYQKALARTVGR